MEETLKSRAQSISDWILLFDAVIRQKPVEIPVAAIIEHQFAIRDSAKSTMNRILNNT